MNDLWQLTKSSPAMARAYARYAANHTKSNWLVQREHARCYTVLPADSADVLADRVIFTAKPSNPS